MQQNIFIRNTYSVFLSHSVLLRTCNLKEETEWTEPLKVPKLFYSMNFLQLFCNYISTMYWVWIYNEVTKLKASIFSVPHRFICWCPTCMRWRDDLFEWSQKKDQRISILQQYWKLEFETKLEAKGEGKLQAGCWDRLSESQNRKLGEVSVCFKTRILKLIFIFKIF